MHPLFQRVLTITPENPLSGKVQISPEKQPKLSLLRLRIHNPLWQGWGGGWTEGKMRG